MNAITVRELSELQTQGQAFTLLDVRRDSARLQNGTQIANALWHNPAHWLDWKDQVPKELPVVVYCAHGHEIGQGMTTVLRVMGLDARYLDGGISAWQAADLGTEPIA